MWAFLFKKVKNIENIKKLRKVGKIEKLRKPEKAEKPDNAIKPTFLDKYILNVSQNVWYARSR